MIFFKKDPNVKKNSGAGVGVGGGGGGGGASVSEFFFGGWWGAWIRLNIFYCIKNKRIRHTL